MVILLFVVAEDEGGFVGVGQGVDCFVDEGFDVFPKEIGGWLCCHFEQGVAGFFAFCASGPSSNGFRGGETGAGVEPRGKVLVAGELVRLPGEVCEDLLGYVFG